ncbi:hypothetical protein DRW03_06380 [Corallococcus sp. H22C18031201]|nr:hypothetical protein DRW03_06380 [Corallococcus sp. H22C18031201]
MPREVPAWAWWLAGGALVAGVVVVMTRRRAPGGTPLVYHRERAAGVDARLLAFLDWWEVHGAFPLVVADKGGRRTSEAEQAALYARGVTKARTLAETPHGRGGALDLVPYDVERRVGLYEGPGVAAQYAAMGAAAKAQGLVWGGDWTSIKDMPHVEVADWRRLPMPSGGTST